MAKANSSGDIEGRWARQRKTRSSSPCPSYERKTMLISRKSFKGVPEKKSAMIFSDKNKTAWRDES